jgi:N-acetylglucosamine kinase-like BadF-type ATPase
MSRFFLGVDIGNTKSHALIADETGNAVGFAHGGPGNHEVLGLDGFQTALHSVTEGALTNAGIHRAQIAGAGYGIAGYDWPSDRPAMDNVLQTLALEAPYEFVNDALMGLIAGTKDGWGVNVSAGTSGNCRGRDQQGREGRVSGNGAPFGEYGGGHELVSLSLQAISRAWSLRGPHTRLSQLFVEHVGAKDVDDLLEGIVRDRYRLSPTDAPVAFRAADEGDTVANDLITFISRELGNLAIGVIRQLEFEDLAFEVVLAGSFYKGSPHIEATVRETIHTVAPGAQLVRLSAPPVVGSVLLGMESAGMDFRAVRDTLIASTAELPELATE